MLSCRNSSWNDGTAIGTRMTTGTTVQITSISVLWVVRDGVGLARALKLHHHDDQQHQHEER